MITNKSVNQIKWSKQWADFRILFSEQVLLMRNILPWYLFLQTVVPLAFVFAMGHYAGRVPEPNTLLQIISGSVTFTLANLGLASMAARLASMRQNGTLLYYSSLPIQKISFVAAQLIFRLVLLLPSIIVPILGGSLMYNLDLQINVWLLVVVGLGAISLVVVGTALGTVIKDQQLVLVLTNALIFVMVLASPTFISVTVLPLPLQLLGWLLPTTYIADALRLSLSGTTNTNFFIDLLILAVMGSFALFVTSKFLVWQAD